MSFLYLGYGIIILPTAYGQNDYAVLSTMLLLTGMFSINYGQLLLGWHGDNFDALLVKNIRFRTFYKAKLMLFIIFTAIFFICTLPYSYFGTKLIGASLATMLFNMGINSFVVMFFGSLQPTRIKLNKSSFMNAQGVDASQFLAIVPMIGAPALIFTPFILFATPEAGYIAVGAIGLLGLLLHPIWLNLLEKWMLTRKYQISEGFRHSN